MLLKGPNNCVSHMVSKPNAKWLENYFQNLENLGDYKTPSWKPKRNLNLQQPNLNSNYTRHPLEELSADTAVLRWVCTVPLTPAFVANAWLVQARKEIRNLVQVA